MAKLNPLNLPEIKHHIGIYLSIGDLKNCILVCKGWKESFACLLWKDVFIKGNWFDGKILQHNRMHVHSLSLKSCANYLYMFTFPNLKSLHIGSPVNLNPFDVVSINNSIASLSLSGHLGHSDLQLWELTSTLPNLAHLFINHVSIDSYPRFRAFCEACVYLTSLTIVGSTLSKKTEFFTNLHFPNLRLLHLKYIKGLESDGQLLLIRQCTELRTLVWNERITSSAMSSFSMLHKERVWPHMESLMMGPRMYGEGLVTLLRHIPQFKKLELHKATIDLGFYESLPRHFNSLVELSLYSCKYVAGPFPPELLESAPNLKVFMCGSMNARDVVKGGPWVCQSLEKLRIRFNFSDDEQGLQPLVFERISQLTRLQVLGNFGWGDVNDVAYQESLDFRLECGLGSLATLVNLQSLFLKGQEMDKADVEWIIQNWKKIETIDGRLNSGSIDSQLRAILNAQRICSY